MQKEVQYKHHQLSSRYCANIQASYHYYYIFIIIISIFEVGHT